MDRAESITTACPGTVALGDSRLADGKRSQLRVRTVRLRAAALASLLAIACSCSVQLGSGRSHERGEASSDSSESSDVEPAAVQLDLATQDRGSVSVGQAIEIQVEENGSVGDAWVLWDPDSLQHLVVAGESFDSECEDGKVGCGGTHTFRFEGRSAGADELVLVNCFRQGSSCADDLTAAEVAALPDHLTDFGPPPTPFALQATITVAE